MERLPLVSVIIPCLNNRKKLEICLRKLQNQSYPTEALEILVIDNGSSDGSLELAKTFPVTVLEEHSGKSPYLARNKGIQASSGEVVVLLDSSCEPAASFIESGILALHNQQAEVAVAKISFTFQAPVGPAQWVDALIFGTGEEIVHYKRSFPAGAFFARRAVFNRFGLFLDGVRSGADTEWSGRVFQGGAKVIFAPEAIVYYEAASRKRLMGKARRFGKGAKDLYREKEGREMPFSRRIQFAYQMLPPNPLRLWQRARLKQYAIPFRDWPAVWLTFWQFKLLRTWEILFRT